MAPRSYNPYRKCDFCGANNYPTYHTRYERRAWTLHTYSNKMTCPNCTKKGEEVERLAIAERIRHRLAMEGIVAGEDHRDTEAQRTQGKDELGVLCDPVPLWYACEPPAAYGFGVPGQYRRIKDQYPDAVLLFRVGDWYVALNEDADTVSAELGTELHRFPPLSTRSTEFAATALDQCLPKLVKAGYRVAICDRVEEPSGRKHLHTEEHGSTAAEPAPLYGLAARSKRYQDIEKGKVLARLEDIAGVLRRHNALRDAPAVAALYEGVRDSVAKENLMTDIGKIREELSLRAVWIDHHGKIICRIDGCWMKFQAAMVPEFIAEARKVYSGKQMSEGLPKLGTARMRFDDEDLLELAEHNARVAAKSGSPALRTYFNALLTKVREAMGMEQRKAA